MGSSTYKKRLTTIISNRNNYTSNKAFYNGVMMALFLKHKRKIVLETEEIELLKKLLQEVFSNKGISQETKNKFYGVYSKSIKDYEKKMGASKPKVEEPVVTKEELVKEPEVKEELDVSKKLKSEQAKVVLREMLLVDMRTLSKVEKKTFKENLDSLIKLFISRKDPIDDELIEGLNKFVLANKRQDIDYNNIVRLIVLSKNYNNETIVKYIVRGVPLKLPEKELCEYIKSMIIYAPNCITRDGFEAMISSVKLSAESLFELKAIVKKHNQITTIESNIVKKKLSKNPPYELEGRAFKPLNSKKLEIVGGRNIITIDDSVSEDLDGAFSIEEIEDGYLYNVYISDVPGFLLDNEELIKPCYQRGVSMYKTYDKELLTYDMLPRAVSHDILSLKKNTLKPVINFSYFVNREGKVELLGVSRNLVYVNDNIDPRNIKERNYNPDLVEDMEKVRKMCYKICKNSDKRNLSNIAGRPIQEVIQATPSIMTNYLIGSKSNFVIFREHGKYTMSAEEKYTHSVTPLRRFVSNINLAMYLTQLGVINCPDKYLYYLDDHTDEILEHLNMQENTSYCFSKTSYDFRRKFVLENKKM